MNVLRNMVTRTGVDKASQFPCGWTTVPYTDKPSPHWISALFLSHIGSAMIYLLWPFCEETVGQQHVGRLALANQSASGLLCGRTSTKMDIGYSRRSSKRVPAVNQITVVVDFPNRLCLSETWLSTPACFSTFQARQPLKI